jgi:hypothetical protein
MSTARIDDGGGDVDHRGEALAGFVAAHGDAVSAARIRVMGTAETKCGRGRADP